MCLNDVSNVWQGAFQGKMVSSAFVAWTLLRIGGWMAVAGVFHYKKVYWVL